MKIYIQIIKNTATGWFEMLVLVLSGIFITPTLINYFGKEGYGIWALVGSIVGYFSLLDLGVNNSVSRFVAKYNANNDRDGLSRTLTNSFLLLSLSVLFIIPVTFLVWSNFADFFNISGDNHHVASWLILITGLGIALSLPMRIGQGICQGIHRFDVVYLLRSMGSIVRLMLIIICFYFLRKGDLILLAVISISAALLPNIIMLIFGWRNLPGVLISKKNVSWQSISEIWSLSFSALIISLSAIMFNQTQVLIIGKIISVETVILFAIPMVLMKNGSMLVSYIITAFIPLASKMAALGENERLRNLNIQGVRISFIVGLGLIIITTFWSEPFLMLWLKSIALESSDFIIMYNMLLIMVSGFCIGSPQMVSNNMLLGTGRQWFVAIIQISNSLISITVSFLLLRFTTLGIYGVAIGWTLFYIIPGLLVYPFAACRIYKIRLLHYIKHAYIPPIISAVFFMFFSYLLSKVVFPSSWIIFLAVMAANLFFYIISIYYLCLGKEYQRKIRSHISSFYKKIALSLGLN